MNSNTKSHNPSLVGYAAAAWLACVLAAASAYADDQSRSETVKFADLDLNTQAGVETLYDRVHAAARRVCIRAGSLGPASNCVREAEGAAIGKVNTPLLTAYYQKKAGIHSQPLTANR
jgi:UrcA family protein